MIRYLNQEEKTRTRAMYEENFPEDPREFVEYYYTHKTKENQILVMEGDSRELQVMIHRNPYEFQICGALAQVKYVVAVATDSSVRKQGKMAKVLRQSLQDSAAAHEPFTFLIPANPKVYFSSSFVFVASEKYGAYAAQEDVPVAEGQQKRREMDLQAAELFGVPGIVSASGWHLRAAEAFDIPEMVTFSNELLKREYDIYPVRNQAYYARAMEELKSQSGGYLLLEPDMTAKQEAESQQKTNGKVGSSRIAGILSYGRDGNHVELQELLAEPEIWQQISDMAEEYFSPVKPEITKMDFMVRMTDLKTFCQMLKSREPISMKVKVQDEIIPANGGCYEIQVDRTGGSIREIPEEEAEHEMDISELTELLFKKVKLFVREWV